MTQFFTAENFVYWTISSYISFVWIQLLCKRIWISSGKLYNKQISLTNLLIHFFVWPLSLICALLIDLLFLLFPKWVISTVKEEYATTPNW